MLLRRLPNDMGLPWWLRLGKERPAVRRPKSDPWLEDALERAWQPPSILNEKLYREPGGHSPL